MSDISEKIQKLLNLARSDNPHEAKLAAQRAQELISQLPKTDPKASRRRDTAAHAVPASYIKKTRQGLGLTQKQFGDLLGAYWTTVSKWERGEFIPSSYQTDLIVAFHRATKHGITVELEKILPKNVTRAVFELLKLSFRK